MSRPRTPRMILNDIVRRLEEELKKPSLTEERRQEIDKQLSQIALGMLRDDRRESAAEQAAAPPEKPAQAPRSGGKRRPPEPTADEIYEGLMQFHPTTPKANPEPGTGASDSVASILGTPQELAQEPAPVQETEPARPIDIDTPEGTIAVLRQLDAPLDAWGPDTLMPDDPEELESLQITFHNLGRPAFRDDAQKRLQAFSYKKSLNHLAVRLQQLAIYLDVVGRLDICRPLVLPGEGKFPENLLTATTPVGNQEESKHHHFAEDDIDFAGPEGMPHDLWADDTVLPEPYDQHLLNESFNTALCPLPGPSTNEIERLRRIAKDKSSKTYEVRLFNLMIWALKNGHKAHANRFKLPQPPRERTLDDRPAHRDPRVAKAEELRDTFVAPAGERYETSGPRGPVTPGILNIYGDQQPPQQTQKESFDPWADGANNEKPKEPEF